MKEYDSIRCRRITIKFRVHSGQNTLELQHTDVGATDYMEVSRSSDELRVHYNRKGTPPAGSMFATEDVTQEVLCFNYESVFSYSCESILTG